MFPQVKNTREVGYTSSLAFQANALTTLKSAPLEEERVSPSDSAGDKKLSLAEKCPLDIWLTVFETGHLYKKNLLKLRLVCKILEKIANEGIKDIILRNVEYLEKALTLFNLKYIKLRSGFELQAQDLVKIKPNITVKSLMIDYGVNDENLPALLGKFPYLEKLGLPGGHFIEFNLVNQWPTLNNLKVAYFYNNKNLVDKNLAVLLKKLPNLDYLDLRRCDELAFNSENEWPTLSDVKTLKLSNHKYLKDENLSVFLSKFPKLEVLVLAYCHKLKFNLVDTTSIAQRDYTATQDKVTSDLPLMWPTVNHIKKLNLAGTGQNQVDEEKIFDFLGRFPKLEKLNIYNCFIHSSKADMHKWPDLPNIKEIAFSDDDLVCGGWDIEAKYPNVKIKYYDLDKYCGDITTDI
ncbi:hypothetical protein [Mycoavidus sp. SF9855]|uniref:hypothetical protein n=1 Tax=Mycoavidus sp. SF9855 TaxID=2968475 RepID=UPI00211C19C3|nr:hypothetical protein [Mycoavidus sp. SF9855]UUM22116.1 hypothetical protein NQD60_03245 [Mycoavidus sp. SF9855]